MPVLSDILLSQNVEFKTKFKLSGVSTFKIGGEADFILFPDTAEKLVFSIRTAKEYGIAYKVVGNASNILFGDGGYRGFVISTKKMKGISVVRENNEKRDIACACGEMLPALSRRTASDFLSGLEFACGIPGTVGGAVFMNAGAHGSQISDVLLSSKAYDAQRDETLALSADEHLFSYRESVYSRTPSLICLEATLSLSFADESVINSRINENMEKRRASQPIELASAGSFFKRPDGYFAAKLIDDCGLKGYRVGGAAVSEKHAGFIVNLGGASSADVLELAEYVSRTVFDKTGVRLEREVGYIERL